MSDLDRDVLDGPWGDIDLPLRIEPGEYEAVYVKHALMFSFGKPKVVIEFRITEPGPGFRVLLDCFYVVNQTGRVRWTVRKRSKLALDIVRLFPEFRGPLKSIQGQLKELFKGRLFLVSVNTVTQDHCQKEYELGYSKIDRIIKVIQ